jgi:glucuronoarabinoxylan endo-1,4-beta-xylanase
MNISTDNIIINTLKAFALIVLFISVNIKAQTFSVKGAILSQTGAVSYASVVFIDNNDTSKKYIAVTDAAGNYQLNVAASILGERNNSPEKFELEQNYPNPFSASTSIPYKLKEQFNVHLTIYDILGREVRKISAGAQEAGRHLLFWDGVNNSGVKAASGIYFYKLQAGGTAVVKKMLLTAGGNSYLTANLNFLSSGAPEVIRKKTELVKAGKYTILIDNSIKTLPAIIPQQFSGILIQSDTIMNFTAAFQNIASVYMDSVQQIIRGFGAANILPWRPDMKTAEVNTAFGTGPGQLGFTILRLRIPYTDDVNEFNANVPTAKLAKSMGAIIIASPWTPPPAMKTSQNIVSGSLLDSSYAAYAAHLKAFADYMASQGVPLYAVSIQNEPDANVNYESCSWTAAQFLKFCKNNAASIGTKIIMPESMSFTRWLSDPILNDSAAAANVSIIGGHIYGGGLSSYPLALSKGKETWMTEHLTTTDADACTWPQSIPVAKEINDCMNSNMSAYIWWYIVRYYGPIDENGNATKRGYIMSQYSKFIRPGYFRIKCDLSPQRNIYITSYKDSASSKTVIVVLNTNSTQLYQTFTIKGNKFGAFSQYATSAAKNCEKGNGVIAVNGSFTAVLEPSSITTFISE